MHGLQSSPNSLPVPIFRCTALTMKRGTAQLDRTSIRVIRFDHKLLIRLHILCFLLGVIIKIRGFLSRMISIGTSCNGTEDGPFRFQPPAIFLAKNLLALRVIPRPRGCGSFGLMMDLLLSFRNLDNTVRSESLTASFTTHTSKQYNSRRHNPSVRADRLGPVRHVVSGVSFALLSWPDISPSAIISCREVLSLVTQALSASFFGTPFPLSSFLGGSLEAMSAIRQLRRLSELRGSCKLGKNYHGARVATVMALT